MNRKLHIVKLLSLVFTVSLFSFLGSIIIYQTKAQWTGAPGLPPSSNVPAPLNVGSSNQQKVGGLTLGKDIYIDPKVSNSTQSGLRLFPNSATGMYGYFFNNLNTLQYNVQTSIGEKKRFTIGNDGNTAIGDIIPQAKLHVDGSIKANGVIQATGKVYSEGNEVLTSAPSGSVGSNEIINSSITSNDIDTSSVQRRVSGTCAVGESIRAIASDGTVTCEADDVGDQMLYHTISNDIIMSAPSVRWVSGDNCKAFSEKSFIVKHGGLFRVTFNLWSDHHSDQARFRVLCNNGQVCSPVLVADTGGGNTSGSYTIDMDVVAQPGSKIELQGQTCEEWCVTTWDRSCGGSGSNEVSRVDLRGTLQIPTAVNNGVFRD